MDDEVLQRYRNFKEKPIIKEKPNAIVNWHVYEQALDALRNQKIGIALDLLDEAVKKVE